MDVLENIDPQQSRQTFNDPKLAGKRNVAFPAKNSHVAWQNDFHRSQYAQPTIIEHPIKEPEQPQSSFNNNSAGVKMSDFQKTKGINVVSDQYANRYQVQSQQSQADTLELAQRVAKKIRSRGAQGIIGLGRAFRVIDDNNDGCLDHDEFAKAMRDYRISQDPAETQAIFEIFDTDKTGTISYNEFLRTIVGEMNDFRRNLATQAFKKFDKTGDGQIDINDLKISHSAKKHPDVMMGKKTEQEVLYEFLDTFESHYALLHPECRDHVINLNEWLEYYNNVSCNIEHDEYFEIMMRNAYNF